MKEHSYEMDDFVCLTDSVSYSAVEHAICENCDLGYANESDLEPTVPLDVRRDINITGTKGSVSCTIYISKEAHGYKLSVYNIILSK